VSGGHERKGLTGRKTTGRDFEGLEPKEEGDHLADFWKKKIRQFVLALDEEKVLPIRCFSTFRMNREPFGL